MIETTHIRIGQAATMLNTDVDTLLIAAAEGRIHASWLFNRVLKAHRGRYEDVEDAGPDEPPYEWVTYEAGFRHFFFVPLQQDEAANLMAYGSAKSDLRWLTAPNPDGMQWTTHDFGERSCSITTETDLLIVIDNVFVMRVEIDAILEKNITSAEITAPQPSASMPRTVLRDDSLIITIAALLAAWPRGAIPSGKDLEKAALSSGLKISDCTLRKALDAAQEAAQKAAPSRPLPK